MFDDDEVDCSDTIGRIIRWEAWERQLPGDARGFKGRTNFTPAPPSDTPYDCDECFYLDTQVIAKCRNYANQYNPKLVSTGPFRNTDGNRYLKKVKYGDLMYDCLVARYRFNKPDEFKATKFGITEQEFTGYVSQFIKAIHYRIEEDMDQAA